MPVLKFKSDQEKFWAKVKIGDECWEWNAGCAKAGYGLFNRGLGRSAIYSHRYAFAQFNGRNERDLACILHKCDNRKCVRPDHLFEGSDKDNMDDKIRKNRTNYESIRFLSFAEIDQIKNLHATKQITQSELAIRYGVSQSYISRILSGERRISQCP